jgi:uncharacterized protein (DUF305 family)
MKRYGCLLAVVCLLLLAGCGDGARLHRRAAQSPRFNGTDVMFLQMMIPHHREGIEMARLAKLRASGADVRTLAAAVEATQLDEVEDMTGWLRAWGEPATADPNPGVHAGHGGMRSTGPARIAALRTTKAADFDRTFLNLLIGHQHNAVDLARMEAAGGVNLQAVDLARRIDESRTAQISLMLRYLQ